MIGMIDQALSVINKSGGILGVFEQGRKEPFVRTVIDRVRILCEFENGNVLFLFYACGYTDSLNRFGSHFILAKGLALDDYVLTFSDGDKGEEFPFHFQLDPIFDNVASDDWAAGKLAGWRAWKKENRGEVEAAERLLDDVAAGVIDYWKRGGE